LYSALVLNEVINWWLQTQQC